MLLSLFDNLIAPKPQPVKQVDETSFQREFEIEVNGENVPVRIMFEPRFNNRFTVVFIWFLNRDNYKVQQPRYG